MIRERVMREVPILLAMSMVFMLSLSDNGQGRNTHNGELAEHLVQNTSM